MSSLRAPAWAMTAEAIDGMADTHLPDGLHVRALPAARLGLPATPLVVYRTVLDPAALERLARTDGVEWRDSSGTVLTPPFDVTPDNPVFGYFPVRHVIWAELRAVPAPGGRVLPPLVFGDIRDVLAQPLPPFPPVGAGGGAAGGGRAAPAVLDGSSEVAARLERLHELIGGRFTPAGTIRFEAMATSARGPAPTQSRSTPPYELAAWTIQFVRVIGRGTVQGIRWLDASRLRETKEELWTTWSLPVDPAPRYTPTANAVAEALDRVQRAAVIRQPMYVAYTATAPSVAPAATPADAVARVAQVQADLDTWLKRLLNDLSAETWQLIDTQPISGRDGSIGLAMEPLVIAGSVDPDVGHYLGLGDVDQQPPKEGNVVLYRIRGLWRWHRGRWRRAEAPSLAGGVRRDLASAVTDFPELEQLKVVPTEPGPFVDLDTIAAAVVGVPPDRPPAISFDAAEVRGWLATPPPPDVRRALRLLASGFRPHAVASLAATDARGDRSLHAYPGRGRLGAAAGLPAGTPEALVVTRPADATGPTEGRFEDRDAPDGPVLYRLAHGDWFGRWSEWRSRPAPPKGRTPPYRPTIEIYPQPPTFGTPVPDTPLHGTIQLRFPIPRVPDLPAGGAELLRLDLSETFEGSPTVALSFALATPAPATVETHSAPAHNVLVIDRSGPDLPRCGSRKVTYTARWVDVLGQVSLESDPAVRTMTDPRPPQPPGVVTELRWASRPDSLGHARVDLDFATTVGTRYRVFTATETSLLRALELGGQTAARMDILAAEPGAPRAGRFRAHKALFGWDHFESVTREPIVATSTTTHFVHRVSGSLDVLTIYRVLGEGPSGALSEMTEADIVPFAVPNLGPPARPLVSLVNLGLDPTSQGVRLRVKVAHGRAVPHAWRLRRSSAPVSGALAMEVVATGAVVGPVESGDGTTFEIEAPTPLKAWRQYRFAVEVQSADPPGAPTVGTILPGEWSEASSPATLAVIPALAPVAPTTVTIADAGGSLQISVAHPSPASLVATAVGPHRFEVWRVEPGSRPARRDLAFIRSGDAWSATDPGPAIPGTYVTVRIIDPAGRGSDATVSNQL